MRALLGLCSFFLLVPLVQWAWPHLCDAALLVAVLGGLLFSCPWVILVGVGAWILWQCHLRDEAEKARQAREARRIERLQESLDRLEAKKAKPPPKARTSGEHSGTEGSSWRWN